MFKKKLKNNTKFKLNNELYKILYTWNSTSKYFPAEKTITKIFEEQAYKTPHSVAVTFNEIKLTYKELNAKANQLAYYLITLRDIKPDSLIALFMNRSEHMIVSILGILKAGAAYVPIDPQFPDERISYILQDTNTFLVISNNSNLDRLHSIDYFNDYNKMILALDNDIVQKKLNTLNKENPTSIIQSNNLAYVIYTSGTTGKPKGVMVEHKGLVNLIFFLVDKYKLENENEVIVLFANYIFDTSIEQIFLALLNGFTLLLLPEKIWLDSSCFYKYLNINSATHFVSTPSFLCQYDFRLVPSLKRLVTAGELSVETTIQKLQQNSNYQVIIEYGPTECSIASIINCNTENNYSIGKPIYNTLAYILNEKLEPVKIGEIGELHIGGVGLARGYLNNPKLTAQKFIPNPYQTRLDKKNNQNNRLYKTGDLVRYLPDGNIEFMGRNDFQIKLRGYRIELGEIENAILKYPQILQCIVLTKENNNLNDNKFLVAYYVTKTTESIAENILIEFLQNKLPNYMLPQYFIVLKKFPLTLSGKLDRNALPEPIFNNLESYIPPQSELEKKLVNIWAQVLNLPEDKVGILDDFFKIGGNSLSAIKIMFLLQSEMNIYISDIFSLKTIKNIANKINNTEQKYNLDNKKDELSEIYKNSINKIKNNYEYLNNKYLKININNNHEQKTILLTGSTGYLGIHILNELLEKTEHLVILLIRESSTIEAIEKLKQKYYFYFNINIDSFISKKKLVILNAFLELDNFYLSNSAYNYLAHKVDTIIHSAALVKHYGEYHLFYNSNVLTTMNIIKFAQYVKNKEIHYISTNSVCENGYKINNDDNIFTEYDSPKNILSQNNYIKSKLEAEKLCLQARNNSIICNIYRIGNLLINTDTQLPQKNIDENASISILKSVLKFKLIAESKNEIEISPVNLTAKFLISLVDVNNLKNEIFHLYNPKKFRISELLSNTNNQIKTCSDKKFIHFLKEKYEKENEKEYIEKIFLHFGWLDQQENHKKIKPYIFQEKTNIILKKLNLAWPEIDALQLKKLIELIS